MGYITRTGPFSEARARALACVFIKLEWPSSNRPPRHPPGSLHYTIEPGAVENTNVSDLKVDPVEVTDSGEPTVNLEDAQPKRRTTFV